MFKINSSKKIALLYFIISIVWIYASDELFSFLLSNYTYRFQTLISIIKGIFFVSITAYILYKLINHYYQTNLSAEKEYKEMFEANPNPKWLCDEETNFILKVNQAAIIKYGYKEEEFKQLSILDLMPAYVNQFESNQEKIKNTHNEIIKGVHLTKSGERFNVEMVCSDILYKNSKVKLMMILDIADKINYEKQISEHQQELEQTIEELKEKKRKINNIQKIAKIVGWVYNINNNEFHLSKEAKELLGSKDIRQLESFDELKTQLVKSDVVKLEDFVESFEKGTQEGDCILRITSKSGVRFIKTGAYLTISKNGDKVLEGYFQDITILELKEQLMKSTIERFEHFAGATNDALYEWNLETKLMKWTGNLNMLFGDEQIEVSNSAAWWLGNIHPLDREENILIYKKSLKNKEKIIKRKYRFKDFNGIFRLVNDQAIVTYDENNHPIKLIGTLQDIDEITRVNLENKRLGEIISKINNMIVITDVNGKISWFNKALLNKTGFAPEEIIGKYPWKIFKYPKSSQINVDVMEKAIKEQIAFSVEIENFTRKNEKFWIQIDGSPIFNDENEFEGYIGIESDITERKAREKKINEQNRWLKEAAWINSHQVRKPLASILALIQLLNLAETEPERLEYVRLLDICSLELDEAIKHASNFVDANNG